VDPDRWLKRAAHLLHRKSFAEVTYYSPAGGNICLPQPKVDEYASHLG
jgi:hypothetical protein